MAMAMAMATNLPLYALYVGDLHPSVTEAQLIAIFSKINGFVSALLCKDMITGMSLRYGYVNYRSYQHAMVAMKNLNYTIINGQRIRIMPSQPNPKARSTGVGNLFVRNLDNSIDSLKLHNIFSRYGRIVSCKVAFTDDGNSKGYGYVQYESPDSANNAIEEANGCTIEGKEICVQKFMNKSERILSKSTFNNLYVKNLDSEVTEELLRDKFSEFGKIISLVISADSNGISKGFGFVCFENPDDAKRAMESLNGTQFGSKALFVARAQKKAEREQLLRLQYEERQKEYKGLNLYIKNINKEVKDDELKVYFSQCGAITSAKIMRHSKGIGRGFGFVCFSTREEANKAIQKLNGVIFHQKPLYVAVAQTKEERKALLQRLRINQVKVAVRLPASIQGSRPYGFPLIAHHRIQPSFLPMIPDSARYYGGRMNGGHHQMPFMHNSRGLGLFPQFLGT